MPQLTSETRATDIESANDVKCPFCGASTIEADAGRAEYCHHVLYLGTSESGIAYVSAGAVEHLATKGYEARDFGAEWGISKIGEGHTTTHGEDEEEDEDEDDDPYGPEAFQAIADLFDVVEGKAVTVEPEFPGDASLYIGFGMLAEQQDQT